MPDKATETVPKLARFPNYAPGNAYRETCRNAEPRWGVCSIFHSIAFLCGFNTLHGSILGNMQSFAFHVYLKFHFRPIMSTYSFSYVPGANLSLPFHPNGREGPVRTIRAIARAWNRQPQPLVVWQRQSARERNAFCRMKIVRKPFAEQHFSASL